MTQKLADAIKLTLISPNEPDVNLEPANVVDGLFFIGRAIEQVARSLSDLGTAGASTPMGAIEVLAMELKTASELIAGAMDQSSTNGE